MSGVVARVARPRRAWVDHGKGIGILLVVFGHVWRGLHTAELPMGAQLFAFVDAWIYSFHMPLFFFLSGLFIERAASKPWGQVVTAKLRAIVYPYLVWTVLYGSANVAFSRVTNTQVSFAQIFPSFLYAPYAHFWFLYVLLGCSLLYVLLYKNGMRAPAIAALSVVFYATIPLFGLGPWGALYMVRSYFVYFALGAWLSDASTWAPIEERVLLAASLALALLGALAVAAGLADVTWAAPLLAVMGTASVVAASRWLEATSRARWLQRLGELSLPIYVAHTLGTAAARIGLAKVAHVDALAVHVVGGMVGGLVLPLALHALAERAPFPYLFTLPRRQQPATATANRLAKAA